MSSERSPLRALGAALLNATLLLAAIVLALALALVWQVRGIAQDLRGSVAVVQPQIDDARAQAQSALQALQQAPQTRDTTAAQDSLRAALTRLEQVSPTTSDEQVEGIMRQFALAIFAFVARMMLDERSAPGG